MLCEQVSANQPQNCKGKTKVLSLISFHVNIHVKYMINMPGLHVDKPIIIVCHAQVFLLILFFACLFLMLVCLCNNGSALLRRKRQIQNSLLVKNNFTIH